MTSTTRTSNLHLPGAPPDIQVANWPLVDDAPRSWLLAAAALLAAVLAGAAVENAALGGLCFAALALCLWRLWTPISYDFGPRGVVQRVLARKRRIPWTAVEGYQVYRRGVLLLPEVDAPPLRRVRGLYIRWGGQKEELLAILKFYLGENS